jgi:hypothetical protein
MIRAVLLRISYGLLIVFLVSCQETNVGTPMASVTPQGLSNWWSKWLAEPVCAPPCWQGITPGLTNANDAISILRDSPEIVITFQSDNGIDWTFNQNSQEAGSLSISPDGLVRMIWLENGSEKKLLLSTIIASYNEPAYVKPYDCREGMCLTALIYPDIGMFLSVFVENRGSDSDMPQFEILADTVVDRIYFIESSKESFLNLYGFPESEILLPWKGYGEYP